MTLLLIESELAQLGRVTNSVQAAAGAAGVFNGAKVHLGKSNLAINPATAYAALSAQEADYDGYASQAIVWGTPATAADGTVEVLGTALLFRPTGDTTENSIYNFWISNGGSTVWYYAGQVQGLPLPMSDVLDQIVVIVRLRPAVQTALDYVA